MSDAAKLRKKRLLLGVKLAVLALVAWGIWRTVAAAEDQFAEQRFSLADVNFGWVLLSGVFYLAGMLPAAIFWHKTLRAMGQHPALGHSLSAFYVSQLGKYVPGKAMVVIVRAGMVRGDRVNTTAAATSVFVETLTYMAVGAVIAAATLAIWFRDQQQLFVIALLLAVLAGVPTIPPLFRHLVKLVGVSRAERRIDEYLAGLNYRLFAGGWLLLSAGWIIMGLSLWATVQALPGQSGSQLELLPLFLAATSLAVVAGFASLLPGGVGVRELVVMQLLAPQVGEVVAIVSAVLIRLVWLASELLISAILYGTSRYVARRARAAATQLNSP